MDSSIILNKVAIIERTVRRAREEYSFNPSGFMTDYTRQDAAILNILRACEAAIDLAQSLIRQNELGFPQHARDAFVLLRDAGWIDGDLAQNLSRMVGFRNIAVHEYTRVDLEIVEHIITHTLDHFLQFTQTILLRT